MSKSYKNVIYKTTVAAAVGDAYSALQELRDEVGDIVDNASEGLSQTQRIQTLGETRDALDGEVDDEPDVPEYMQEDPISYVASVHRSSRGTISRAVRRDNACSMLGSAKERAEDLLNELDEDDEYHPGAADNMSDEQRKQSDERAEERRSDLEQLISELDDCIDCCENCEFPGMFG